MSRSQAMLPLIFLFALLVPLSTSRAQVGDDLQVGGEAGRPVPAEGAPEPGAPGPDAPGADGTPSGGEPLVETFVTVKEGWQKKGASRIYDAIDGRLIINDVSIRPFRLSRREASRKYDNGTHGDEVPRDGIPSRIQVNSTDYMGPRTAANYDELKGILFSIGDHVDGPQRFFDQLMISLDWDGNEVDWDPSVQTSPGVYRLSSLEKRMYAFIIRDSLEIMSYYQNAEGKDLIPYEDRVTPPTGLSDNTLQSKRESQGIRSWNSAIQTGDKVRLEREMIAALADTEISDASWFPGGISALSLSKLGAQIGPTAGFAGLGLGGAAFGGGFGAQGGGSPTYGGGQQYGGGQGYGGPGAYGGGAAAGLNPRGVNIRPPTGGYGGVGVGGVSPLGGSLGFAF